MPVDVAELLKEPEAKPQITPPEAPKAAGIDLADLVKPEAPKTPPMPGKEATKAMKGLAHDAAVKFEPAVWAHTLGPYVDDMNKWAGEYSEALKKDVNAYPEGTADRLLASIKTVYDGIGYVSGAVMSPLYTGVINPLKQQMQKLGDLVKKHAAEDVYNAQARREGNTGQQYPKGIDWAIHKQDVQRTVDSLQDVSEALINVGVGFVPGEKLGIKSPERPTADARVALRDMKSAVEPTPPPKLEPITLSLDKTMGFGKISETIGKELSSLPVGANRTTASILDSMIPHAEGYAKSFLEKLLEHIDPNVPVKFMERVGVKDNLGAYHPSLNVIGIKVGGTDIVHTVVHEMVHAATLHMMNDLIKSDLNTLKTKLGRELTDTEKTKVFWNPTSPILKELDKIIAEARIRAQKVGVDFYGLSRKNSKAGDTIGKQAFNRMSPRYEFIAEVFSNPQFQEFLANSEKYASAGYKFKDILHQFGYMIGKHLGMDMPHEARLLNQSMRVGTRLIEMQSSDKPAGRAVEEIVARPQDGGTITKRDMQAATSEVARVIDKAGVRRAKTALQISAEQILRAVSPESLGKNAKLAAAVVASRISEQMQRTAAWRYGSDTRLKFWRARPDFTKEFIDRFEKGENFSDPILKDLARRYKEWGQKIAEHDRTMGFDYEPRDNYLYHVFEDSAGVTDYFTRKYGSKWGDPKWIKERTFNLYKEAVAAGFQPKFDNPEDIMLARQHASDIAEMHIGIMNDLASYGLATRKVVGKEELVKTIDAEGKVQFDIKKTPGTKQPEGTVRWRAPNGDVFWVDAHADAILQNAFKSKSLWEDKGGVGMAFRGMMALKNALVPIRLALSLFHPLHVIGIDAAAGMTRDLSGMLAGTTPPHSALASLLKNGLLYRSLYENPKAGWRVMQVWRGKIPENMLNSADAEALKHIVEGGMIPEMSSQYRLNARQNFANALIDAKADFRIGNKAGLVGDALRTVWHMPWAMISALSKPIFEDWIPTLKTASYLKDVKNLLTRNPELTENDAARQLALRKLAKSVDNRYGEMAYNTLFWKRWVKDLAVLDTLSLGWQLGFLREYGGGALDAGRFAAGSGKLERIRKGELDRPIFVASYTTLGAGIAGLMTWGMTGEAPNSLLDYISPRTGEKNPDGSDQRVSTMFYSREFAALYKHMQNEGVVSGLKETVVNKGSGLFGLMHEWATGVNGFGQEIRDPNGTAFQKLEQTLAYSLSDIEPISMKAIQENVTEKPLKAGALTVLGFTPAPKYLTESKTEADIKTMFRNYVAPKETPFEKAEYSKEFSQLKEAYQSGGENYGTLLDKMVERYELSGQDQRRLIRSLNSDLPAGVRMFMRLPWQQQRKLLDKMSPEERDTYLPHSNREHVRNVYEAPQ